MTRELFNSEPIVELFLSKAMNMNILPKPKYIVSYYDIEDEISNLSNKMKILSNDDVFKNIEYVVKNLNLLVNAEDVLSKNITTERNFII